MSQTHIVLSIPFAPIRPSTYTLDPYLCRAVIQSSSSRWFIRHPAQPYHDNPNQPFPQLTAIAPFNLPIPNRLHITFKLPVKSTCLGIAYPRVYQLG